jgi:hypothetical protein
LGLQVTLWFAFPQHLGGLSLVDKVTSAILSTGDGETNNVLLDLCGFDGWPASFAMTQVASGHFWVGVFVAKHCNGL